MTYLEAQALIDSETQERYPTSPLTIGKVDIIRVGYIRRTYSENNIPHFKFIVAKVKSVRIGAKATKVYTKEFYPLDLEDLESTTEMIDTSKGILIVQEPFILKDGEEKYFQAVVDKWNKEPPKSIFE